MRTNINRIIYFVIVAAVLIIIPYTFLSLYLNSFVETFRNTFQKNVEFLSNSISFRSFQWDEMYDAVTNDDKEFLEEQFKDIIKNYPFTEKVHIENKKPEFDSLYKISSDQTKIYVEFKIYDSFGEKNIQDKVAIAVFSAQKIVDYMGVKNLEINKFGKPFVYNLRYYIKPSIADISIALSVFSIVLLLLISVVFIAERNYRKAEETHKKALQAISELSQSLLKGVLEPTYQLLLDYAVKIIPGAQAGSVLTKENDFFVFSAVVGYDFETLSKVKFKPEELAQGYTRELKIIKRIGSFDKQNLPDEKIEQLRDSGKTEEIKSTLAIPIVINNEIVAFLNLDNFESENAFGQLSVEIGKAFANQLGLIFEKIRLEKELLEKKEALEYLALHDPLTGLPNRRFLEIELERMLTLAQRENKYVCLLYLDLKKFKPVNDKYGHDAGDYVLKVLAERFRNVVRKSDFVSRVGGDEFIFLLYDCKDYINFLERILGEIEKDVFYSYSKINISGNFGIAIYPDDAKSPDDLIMKADMAMYYAKTNDLKFYLARNIEIKPQDSKENNNNKF